MGVSRQLPTAKFLVYTALLSLSYAFLRFEVNREYSGATWQQLYELAAPIPFGLRMLVPLLSRPLVEGVGLTITQAYFVWEFIFTFGLILTLRTIFRRPLASQWAEIFSLSFIYLLPMGFLLHLMWPVFYPCDTAAIFFIAFGIHTILADKWRWLPALVFVATLNRESAILIPLVFCAFHAERITSRRVMAQSFLMILAFAVARWITLQVAAGNPQPYDGSFALILGDNWRINQNILWAFNPKNLFVLLGTMSFLPLFWHGLKDYMAPHDRRMGLVAGTYFAGLLFVGNLWEPRIFGEIIIILYIPLVLGLHNYLNSQNPSPVSSTTVWVNTLDRFGAYAIIAAVLLGCAALNQLDENPL